MVGATTALPFAGLPAPVENPAPTHEVAFEVHVSVDGLPGSMVSGLAEKVPVNMGNATATGVHAPQLLLSFDSVIVPMKEALLSAHARTYQVPAVGKVYETCDTSVPPVASAGDVSVLVSVIAVWSALLSNWKRFVNPAPVAPIPMFDIVEENVVAVPVSADGGETVPGVRSADDVHPSPEPVMGYNAPPK